MFFGRLLWLAPLFLCLGCPTTNTPTGSGEPARPVESSPGGDAREPQGDGVWQGYQDLQSGLDGSHAAALRLAAFLLDCPTDAAIALVDACILAPERRSLKLEGQTRSVELPGWSPEAVEVLYSVQQILRGSATRYLVSKLVQPSQPGLVVALAERGADLSAALELALLQFLCDFETGWPDDRAAELLAGQKNLGPEQASRLAELVDHALAASRAFCLDRIIGLLHAEQTEAGIAALERLTREAPQFAPGWALLAAQKVDDDRAAAEAALAKAQALDPSDPQCLIARAELAAAGEDFAAAEEIIAAGLASRPEDFRLLQWQGDLRWHLGGLEEALALYLRVVELVDREVDIMAVVGRIAQVAVLLEEWELAERAQTRYLQAEPSFYHQFYRAVSRAQLGRYAEALGDVRSLLAEEDWKAEHGAQFLELRANLLASFREVHGALRAGAWALRYGPGERGMEDDLQREVLRLLATGAEVVLPAVGSRPAEEAEPEDWQGKLTPELERFLASRGQGETRYRRERARWEACRSGLISAGDGEGLAPAFWPEPALERLRDRMARDALRVRDRFWSTGNWSGMVDECDRLLARYPATQAYIIRGQAHLALFDYEAALRDACLAVGIEALESSEDPERGLMPQALALARLCLHQLQGGASPEEQSLLRAWEAVREQRWLDAWMAFKEAREAAPDPQDLPYPLSELYAISKHQHHALYSQTLVELGREALADSALDFARALGDNLWILDPPAEGYAFLAELAQSQGNLEEWEIALENALFDDPFFAPSHRALGELYRERGELERALLHFNAGCEGAGATDFLYESAQDIGQAPDGHSRFAEKLTGEAQRCLELRTELEAELGKPAEVYARGFDARFPTSKFLDLGLMAATCTRLLGLTPATVRDQLGRRAQCYQWLGAP